MIGNNGYIDTKYKNKSINDIYNHIKSDFK